MEQSQQRSQAFRRWREHWLSLQAVAAALSGLVGLGVVWRWGLAGLAVACGIAVVGWLIVWAVMMPGRLAPPVPTETLDQITDAKARLEVIDARTRLHHDLRNGALQLLTVVAVLVGAGLGFQQLAEDRDQARQDRELTRQGQASERFTRAISQLGSTTAVETRIGGIYGLDQIAEQSPDNTRPVGEVLLAWLNRRPRPDPPPEPPLREHAPDVQAALTVLTGQRYSSIVANRPDLHALGLTEANLTVANLTGANLSEAKLSVANLSQADLSQADLTVADLLRANLNDANLRNANLSGADLENADLRGADLIEADLNKAELVEADLSEADLSGADLIQADMRGADLLRANLNDADLRGANLSGADLRGADLSVTDLTGAVVDGNTRPTGFDWRGAGAQVAAP